MNQKELRAELDRAVMARFAIIRPRFQQRTGDYLYSSHNWAWRFRQNHSQSDATGLAGLCGIIPDTMPTEVALGQWDSQIEETWHDEASARYFYRYEKDWGREEEEDKEDEEEKERGRGRGKFLF